MFSLVLIFLRRLGLLEGVFGACGDFSRLDALEILLEGMVIVDI